MAVVWALVGVVLCLATHAQGQLGEGVEEDDQGTREEAGSVQEGKFAQNSQEKEDAVKDDDDSDDSGDDAGIVMPVKNVDDTYQGCYKQVNGFNDTGGVMFINLTEVMSVHNLSSVWAGCLHMCLVTEPFSHYISVSLHTNTSGSVDSCGCHLKDHIDKSNKVSDDSNCDDEPQLYRIYCGPWNQKCYNVATCNSVMSTAVLITSLIITIFSSHYSYLDVR